MAFFSFFYSNLARFKRFKGLGFEAELWEDKQKEAANLIDRLKSVVAIYTREIVMNNVMRGRWGGSENWRQRWALFDELVDQHNALGQEIDFSDLKAKMDGVFTFDICLPLAQSVERSIHDAKNEVRKQFTERYGKVVTDLVGHNADVQKLNGVASKITDGLFERAPRENIARLILDAVARAQEQLETFGQVLQFNPAVLDRLRAVAAAIEERPLVITEQLLEWSEADHKEFR
jgi:hypothetical protein